MAQNGDDIQINGITLQNATSGPKYKALADEIVAAINGGRLHEGDPLPSVKALSSQLSISPETVFKAYSILKEQGTIQSVPSKGFYVANQIEKVFVFLDTFKAYKEVLYDALTKNLPKDIIADVNFHHYKPEIFRKLVEESLGKYTKWIIMPFEGEGVKETLAQIDPQKLLIIDWNIFKPEGASVIYQDFGEELSKGLNSVLHLLKKYDEVHFLYPEYTQHPYVSVDVFIKFCEQQGICYKVETDSTQFNVQRGVAYLSVSDRMLGHFLQQCRDNKLKVGEDVGFISYNETPMKPFIDRGITVFSTDFQLLGKMAADFVVKGQHIEHCIPSKMIIRESL